MHPASTTCARRSCQLSRTKAKPLIVNSDHGRLRICPPVEDVGLGHVTKMNWNHKDAWIWSTDPTHEPLIDTDIFQRAQDVRAAHGIGRTYRERRTTRHHYVFRGLHCGVCGRRMQGQQNKQACTTDVAFPPNTVSRTRLTIPETSTSPDVTLLTSLDQWLSTSFFPH